MTANTNVSGTNTTVPAMIGTKTNSSFLAMGIVLALILIGAKILLTKPGTNAIESRSSQALTARYNGLAAQHQEASLQKAATAWTARNQGLADAYLEELGLQKSSAAWSARYQGLADDYQQRVANAWAARNQGLADAYLEELGLDRAAEAWVARYQALAAYFDRINHQRASDAWAARNQGLAAFYAQK